jgi:hypothetical protein
MEVWGLPHNVKVTKLRRRGLAEKGACMGSFRNCILCVREIEWKRK